jgi:hypothetical protein
MSEAILRLSNSEAATFRRCRRKWYLSVYRRLAKRAPDKRGSALSIGNLVHDSLADYYANGNDPVAFAEKAYAEAVKESPGLQTEIEKEKDLTIKMLTGYMEWLQDTGADADLQILGAERMVEVPLDPRAVPGVTLLSKLDAPIQRVSDGAKLALEHKTVTSLDQHDSILRTNTQYLTEHLVRFLDLQQKGASVDEAHADCTGVLLNMLRKVKRTAAAKPPFYDRRDVEHNIIELRNHWKHVLSIALEILNARRMLDSGASHHAVAPPNPTRDCSWDCPFFLVCPMFDDGSRVEDALATMYEERDPLERYANAEEI